MKLNVKMRLYLAFGLLIGALVGLGVYAIYSVGIVNEQSTVINESWLPGIDRAHSMNTNTSDYRIWQFAHIVSKDDAEMSAAENAMDTILQSFNQTAKSYEETILSEEDRQIYDRAITEWNHYLSLKDKILELSKDSRDEEAMSIMQGDAKTAFDDASNAFLELVEFNQKNAKEADETGNQIYSSAMKILIATIVIVSLVALAASLYITSSILRPIRNLSRSAETIAAGDLDVEIDAKSSDEIGQLAKSFKKMAENINEILTNINNAAEEVASGSRQVSESGVALSQGATEQASSIEELTASMEEIAAQTTQNAGNANQANQLALSAKSDAVKGNSQMKEMLTAMQDINESSGNISKIIKVIDEIAFQTNILALNAAVEAARAGQHGKGFAVVAEEVRNLAARSANAAKETTAMIEGSVRKVEDGTSIANQTAEALNEIVDGITQVAELVNQIATASNEQAAGISQVNQGIAQVSQVTQMNSATSEESAAASEQLSSQAEMLKEQVSRFKLKKNMNTYRAMEEMSPEVMRMLESMSGKRKQEATIADREAAATKPRIALSDNEFGKY